MSLTEGGTTDITGLTVKNAGDQGVYMENSTVKFATFAVDKTKSAAFSLGKAKDIDETDLFLCKLYSAAIYSAAFFVSAVKDLYFLFPSAPIPTYKLTL